MDDDRGPQTIDAPTLISLPSAGPPVDLVSTPVTELDFSQRYERRDRLGEGGMGVVELCRDALVGREVALKCMHPEFARRRDANQRFVREARVQGQLDHPSIVPVYDLGLTPTGSVYFTMKRVRGSSLSQIVEALAAGDARAARHYSRHRLLSAFAQACLAIDFAHERGVVHRDLKPANLMLGDFGEVYVLDWGIARPLDDESGAAEGVPLVTAPGSIVGTPGYLAPEVIQLGSSHASRATDVYALGAILYELLTLVPLFGGSVPEILRATLYGTIDPPAARAPDRGIDPELDAICMRALEPDPSQRYPTARAVHDALESYLAGRRDEELRRAAAARHAAAGEASASLARTTGESSHREVALREVGRALALDADNREAMRVLVGLLTEPSRELPPEARERLAQEEVRRLRVMARFGVLAYAAVAACAPLVLWMGVRDWTSFFVPGGLGLVTAAFCAFSARARAATPWRRHAIMIGGCATFAATSLMFGPYLFVPGLIAAHTVAMVLASRARDRWPYVALACVAFTIPVVLQWTGVARALVIRHDELSILPQMAFFAPLPTNLLMFSSSLAAMLIPILLVLRVRRILDASDERRELSAWHLARLVPEPAARAEAARDGGG